MDFSLIYYAMNFKYSMRVLETVNYKKSKDAANYALVHYIYLNDLSCSIFKNPK